MDDACYPGDVSGILRTGCRFILKIPVSQINRKKTLRDTVKVKTKEELNKHLYKACKWDDEVLIDVLLEKGADPYSTNTQTGMTPILESALFGSAKSLKILSKKLRMDEKNRNKHTVIFLTAAGSKFQYKEKIKLLLEAGIRMDGKLEDGENALLAAAEEGNKETVKYLLHKKNMDVLYKDKKGEDALIRAAKNDRVSVVIELVKHRINVNSIDKKDMTSLMHAVDGRASFDVVKILIGSGADASLKDNKGRTALNMAWEKYETNHEVIKLLEEATKKQK
jgi:ankyrin repeat protein